MTNTDTAPTSLYDAVADAHAELLRLAGRSAADWHRDGYGIHAAQAAVDAARERYMKAFEAYAGTA